MLPSFFRFPGRGKDAGAGLGGSAALRTRGVELWALDVLIAIGQRPVDVIPLEEVF
jgi:hypothetical protein